MSSFVDLVKKLNVLPVKSQVLAMVKCFFWGAAVGWRSLLRHGGRVAQQGERSETKRERALEARFADGICALNLKMKLHKYTKMCILFI